MFQSIKFYIFGILTITVDKNEVKTSLAGTINKYDCRLFQGNIIIDEDIPIVRTLTTYLKKSNPISIMATILMAILLV